MNSKVATVIPLTLFCLIILAPFAALAQNKIVPTTLWWQQPMFSPDGSMVAVHSPPPVLTPIKNKDGTTSYGQTEPVPRKTLILKVKDFSLLASFDQEFWSSWSPDSKYICGDGFDRDFRMFFWISDATSGKKIRSINYLPPASSAWSPDSTRLFVTQSKGMSICDFIKKTDMPIVFNQGETSFDHPVWSPDGNTIAASLETKTVAGKQIIRAWDTLKAKQLFEIALTGRDANFSWSPDGKFFIYSEPSVIKVLDAVTNKSVTSIATVGIDAALFNWSPDKKHFSFQDAGIVHVLDASTMKETLKIHGAKNGFYSYYWSPDNNYILLSSQENAAICDAKTGKYLGYKSWPDCEAAKFAPDGKSIILWFRNFTPRIEALSLPPKSNTSVFQNGKIGSPGWENNASPATLAECFAQFDKDLSAKDREIFKNTDQKLLGEYGGGSFITNAMMANVYCKWDETLLKKYFLSQGISDSRDVTGIVLLSYWRHLNQKPLDVEGQINNQKSWQENNSHVIVSNKPLSATLLNCRLKDMSGNKYSVATIQAKLKILSFVDTDGLQSAQELKYLKELQKNHASKDLAIIVGVVPSENLTAEKWPAIKTKVMGQSDSPARDIAGFLSNHGNIIVSDAPLEFSQALLKFANVGKYTRMGPPQTLVITNDGIVKLRLNGFEAGISEGVLEKAIKDAGL